MTIEQFNRLKDSEKIKAVAVALAQDSGGKLLVTSGMLATVPLGSTVTWRKDPSFNKIVWMVGK